MWKLAPGDMLVFRGDQRHTYRNRGRRIAVGIKTTFASHYSREISLAEALSLDSIAIYGRQSTGEKYLINPNKSI